MMVLGTESSLILLLFIEGQPADLLRLEGVAGRQLIGSLHTAPLRMRGSKDDIEK